MGARCCLNEVKTCLFALHLSANKPDCMGFSNRMPLLLRSNLYGDQTVDLPCGSALRLPHNTDRPEPLQLL